MKKKMLKRMIIVVVILIGVNGLLMYNFGSDVINKSNEVVNDIGNVSIDYLSRIYAQLEEKDHLYIAKKLVEGDNNSLKEQNRLLSSENEKMKSENAELSSQVEKINGIKKNNPNYEYIPGEIIRRDSNDWYDQATINLGKSDGISKGSAVLYRGTLLGYVNEVDENYSIIKLITSENVVINIPAMATQNKKNYNGQMSHFDKDDNTFQFESFSPDVKLNLYNKIYTNGYTNGVPKGIEIGQIVNVKEDETLKKTIYKIKPTENLYDARYITVMEAKNEN